MNAYLDHAATTPLRAEAFAAMEPWLTGWFGNPSGGHAVARRAAQAVDEARESIAGGLGCEPGEVVFTSGGTEADNLAITGVVGRSPDRTAVCSAIEHHAVLDPVHAAGGRVVGVSREGLLDLEALRLAVGPDTAVVSVMLANNEIGVVQDLDVVASVVAESAPDALLHTDAVQAAPWMDVATAARRASLVSVAAHKFGGPQGVGALVVRRGVRVEPLLRGGGQERERRSGTHNVAGIVGMAAALAATQADRDVASRQVGALRDRLVAALSTGTPGIQSTVTDVVRLPGIAHLLIEGVESEALLVLLDRAGVCASAGSSCASGAMNASHVLLALGLDRDRAREGLRFSLGRVTTTEEVDYAGPAIIAAVDHLRSAVKAGT